AIEARCTLAPPDAAEGTGAWKEAHDLRPGVRAVLARALARTSVGARAEGEGDALAAIGACGRAAGDEPRARDGQGSAALGEERHGAFGGFLGVRRDHLETLEPGADGDALGANRGRGRGLDSAVPRAVPPGRRGAVEPAEDRDASCDPDGLAVGALADVHPLARVARQRD